MENQNIINEEKGNDVNHVLAPVSFEKWYSDEQRTFHCSHYDDKQIARSAFIEGAANMKKLILAQKDIEPEYVEIVNKMFWSLI
jgi:hypothetical protein